MRRDPEPTHVDQLEPRRLELRVTCWSCRHRTRISGSQAAAILSARRRSLEIAGLMQFLRCSMCRARTPEVRVLPLADAREVERERRVARD